MLVTVNYRPHKQTQEDQVMLLSLIALGCFDKHVSYLLNINTKLTYPKAKFYSFSLNVCLLKASSFPTFSSEFIRAFASPYLLLMGGKVSSLQAPLKGKLGAREYSPWVTNVYSHI